MARYVRSHEDVEGVLNSAEHGVGLTSNGNSIIPLTSLVTYRQYIGERLDVRRLRTIRPHLNGWNCAIAIASGKIRQLGSESIF